MLSAIADFCGIAGLVFSVGIWVATRNIKSQLLTYKQSQKGIITNLTGLRESIIRDGIYTLAIRSKLRTELHLMLQNYSSLLSPWDKMRIRKTILLLNAKDCDPEYVEKLCSSLDYIIARFQRREVK